MRHTWEEITSIISLRRRADAPLIRRMINTRDHYNGDVTVPLVNVPEHPEMNALMPFLVADGIEGTAMRAAGPMPNIHTPAIDQLKLSGKRSVEYAAIRRRVLYARWHRSRMQLLLGRAYRQLVGYGTFGMIVTPDYERGGAKIGFRDALGSYPSLRAPEDLREPENVGFVFGRSADWVVANYSQTEEEVGRWQEAHPEEKWDIVEWIDDTDIVTGLLGPRSMWATDTPSTSDTAAVGGMELDRIPNRAEMVTAVVPRRVTLDRLAGQLEKIIPMEEWAARLMALDVAAAERFVYPDMVVIGDEGRTPTIVGGNRWRDGRTGDVNLLQNVKAVQQLQGAPGPLTQQTLDRIIENARGSGGVSSFFAGQPSGSLRTGRALDALGGYSIDPRIAEMQIIMAFALETVNRAVCAVETGYFPNQKYVVFSGWPSDRGTVEYTPRQHFETQDNTVSYTFPGSDVSAITVAVGQLAAAKLMSRHTARDKHPMIEDAEMEDELIVSEAVDDAMLVAWQEAIASGQVSWAAVASFKQKLSAGVLWSTAILEVNLEEQERQAAAQAQQQQAMAAAQQGQSLQMGPASQPGLGGGPQALPAVPPPNQGTVNMASMVRALSAGQRRRQGVEAG